MEQNILSIAGKPGLFLLVSRGRATLIVESIDEQKKRFSVGLRDKITSLNDISMYTDDEDTPLMNVFQHIYDQRQGAPIDINPKQADKKQLADFMATALPNYDRDRVYPGDIKKLINWYNILVRNGYTRFVTEEEQKAAEASGPEAEEKKD
jgi:hypothetical protein